MFSWPESIDTHLALAPLGAARVGAVITWLQHPKYAATRDRLITYLTSERYRFRRLAPVLFLCGGAGSKRRDTLRAYLQKHKPWVNIFYAELVWDSLSAQTGLSALKMERDLAALADMVVIIVESPGTFAELGAFSLSDDLRKKLLPIVDTMCRKVTITSCYASKLVWRQTAESLLPMTNIPNSAAFLNRVRCLRVTSFAPGSF